MSLILASVAFTRYTFFSWVPYFNIDNIGQR